LFKQLVKIFIEFQVQQNQEQDIQLLNFQQNLSNHESLCSSRFQAAPYSISNVTCQPVYSNYFNTSTKRTTISTVSSNNNLASVNKFMYNEPLIDIDTSMQHSNQEQFSFNSVTTLAHL
jgi:hypothetical protein